MRQANTHNRHDKGENAEALAAPAAGVPAAPSVERSDRSALTEAFLASQDVKDSTLRTYRQSLDRFWEWLDATGRSLGELTEADVVAYKKAMLDRGRSALTVRSYLTAVRRLYAWAEGRKLYPDIAKSVKAPRQGGGFMKMHLTAEQSTALLEHFEGQPRNYAMVNLMLRTGLRTVEVTRARIGDVRRRGGRRILMVWGKGMDAPDANSYVILTDATWGPLGEYLGTRPGARDSEFLFVTEGRGSHPGKPNGGCQMSPRLVQMTVKEGLRAIGLDGHAYSAHSLRHTTAAQLILNGGTVMDVKRALRHSSVNTSLIYTASVEEDERLRNPPEALLDGAFGTCRGAGDKLKDDKR